MWLAANQEGQFGTTFDMLACSVPCHGAGPDQIVGRAEIDLVEVDLSVLVRLRVELI